MIVLITSEEGVIYTSFKIGDCEIVQDGKYYNYITKEILEDMLRQVDKKLQIIDYFESVTCTNVNMPTANWGNYLIRKRKL